jgi:hypothetical protein
LDADRRRNHLIYGGVLAKKLVNIRCVFTLKSTKRAKSSHRHGVIQVLLDMSRHAPNLPWRKPATTLFGCCALNEVVAALQSLASSAFRTKKRSAWSTVARTLSIVNSEANAIPVSDQCATQRSAGSAMTQNHHQDRDLAQWQHV